MKQQVQATTEIDTNEQWCGKHCRFRQLSQMGDSGGCLLWGGCQLDRVLIEEDGGHWTHYEDRRCAACLVATGDHMLMTNTQYAAWLVAEQGYQEVPGGNGCTVLTRPLDQDPDE